MSKQPSPAAMRAAKKLEGYFGDRATMPTVDGAAEIIRREYAPLVEAARAVLKEHPCGGGECCNPDCAANKLRSALSQSGGAL